LNQLLNVELYYMSGPYVDVIMYSHFIKVRRKLRIQQKPFYARIEFKF